MCTHIHICNNFILHIYGYGLISACIYAYHLPNINLFICHTFSVAYTHTYIQAWLSVWHENHSFTSRALRSTFKALKLTRASLKFYVCKIFAKSLCGHSTSAVVVICFFFCVLIAPILLPIFLYNIHLFNFRVLPFVVIFCCGVASDINFFKNELSRNTPRVLYFINMRFIC